MVGALLIKDNQIIGKGYHHHFGGKHAEINAIQNAREDISGAVLYVTLEPCCHYGKTPPCVDAVIQNKIGKVIIGTLDPDPRVNGRSVEILRQHGIETRVGVLEEECRSLNEAHFKYMTTGVPLVTVKFAQTLDGRIATSTRNSQWLSSPASRQFAHKLRSLHDAVMVGIGTVLADDPQLTVRLVRGRNPTRIILDSRLKIPLDAKVLMNQESAPTIMAATSGADDERLSALRQMGAEVLISREDEHGEVDLGHLLEMLGQRGISSVLVEGGAEVITSLLRLNLVDRLVVIVAPMIMGKGIEAVGELNISDVSQTLKLSFGQIYRRGGDLIIEARVNH
jgi:diaminohydroxyphosphoribosylaminopyrimidine deaminase/5-amino-6-(5-phosphoribosylamino)uracil reductase